MGFPARGRGGIAPTEKAGETGTRYFRVAIDARRVARGDYLEGAVMGPRVGSCMRMPGFLSGKGITPLGAGVAGIGVAGGGASTGGAPMNGTGGV